MSAPSFQRICPVPCLSCHVTSCRWWLRRKELVTVNLCEENKSTFYAFIDGYVNLLFFWVYYLQLQLWSSIEGGFFSPVLTKLQRELHERERKATHQLWRKPMIHQWLASDSKAPRILELPALWHVKSSEKKYNICDTDTIWYGMIWHYYATSLDI